jgi:ABC-2 type transport system ATP-binding protein
MIEVQGLTKRYGDVVAVDGLSFEVQPGHVTGFLGPNGSGKSTTMRMIMGLAAPDAGEASINGRLFHTLPWPLREVGALLDARTFHPSRSAFDHLKALAQTNRIPVSRVDEVLEVVGLHGVARRRAGEFSLGMSQRLGIASALLGDPPVLLFDEPVNGLDPEGILWVRNLLQSLAAEGRTVLVSSHLLSEMALTAEHLVVIGRGRLIADTSVGEFVGRGCRGKVRVRTPRCEDLMSVLEGSGGAVAVAPDGALLVGGLGAAVIGDLAAAKGIALHELAPEMGSLEQAFMELTRDAVEFHGEGDVHHHVDDDPLALGVRR